jgi:glycerophosphoryl diester phosphodiesterase
VFRIVAHRGVTAAAPENTMAAFRRALELGIDAVELDVRLTRDQRPAVYHYYYLDNLTTASGPIFARTAAELDAVRVIDRDGTRTHRIPMLEEVLEEFAGRLGFEIELKGPELEAADVAGRLLTGFRSSWDRIEVTSFEPAILASVRSACRGLATALLFPRSEDWMRSDVVAYAAMHRARLAGTDAVHLHPSQLGEEIVASIRAAGIEVHAHSVNDLPSLELAMTLALPWICSDEPERAAAFRRERESS